jgi:hypothetical protein
MSSYSAHLNEIPDFCLSPNTPEESLTSVTHSAIRTSVHEMERNDEPEMIAVHKGVKLIWKEVNAVQIEIRAEIEKAGVVIGKVGAALEEVERPLTAIKNATAVDVEIEYVVVPVLSHVDNVGAAVENASVIVEQIASHPDHIAPHTKTASLLTWEQSNHMFLSVDQIATTVGNGSITIEQIHVLESLSDEIRAES